MKNVISYLLLELEESVHEGLGGGGTARHVDVNGHNSVAGVYILNRWY